MLRTRSQRAAVALALALTLLGCEREPTGEGGAAAVTTLEDDLRMMCETFERIDFDAYPEARDDPNLRLQLWAALVAKQLDSKEGRDLYASLDDASASGAGRCERLYARAREVGMTWRCPSLCPTQERYDPERLAGLRLPVVSSADPLPEPSTSAAPTLRPGEDPAAVTLAGATESPTLLIDGRADAASARALLLRLTEAGLSEARLAVKDLDPALIGATLPASEIDLIGLDATLPVQLGAAPGPERLQIALRRDGVDVLLTAPDTGTFALPPASEGCEGRTVCATDGDTPQERYDSPRLYNALVMVKASESRWSELEAVEIVAEPGVPFSAVAGAVDIVRRARGPGDAPMLLRRQEDFEASTPAPDAAPLFPIVHLGAAPLEVTAPPDAEVTVEAWASYASLRMALGQLVRLHRAALSACVEGATEERWVFKRDKGEEAWAMTQGEAGEEAARCLGAELAAWGALPTKRAATYRVTVEPRR